MSDSDGQRRPPLPAEIRRRVLVEAGHRCAIPTCRHIEVDLHHIIPWADCKAHDYENLIALCPNCHRRADGGQIDRKSLRLYKVNLRFAHDKFSNLEIDLLFEASKQPEGHGILWPVFNVILLKRILEAGYVTVSDHPMGSAEIMGMRIAPVILSITAAGSAFIAELGLHEL